MGKFIWKKVVCLTTEKNQEIKINVYSDGLEIILPDGDMVQLDDKDYDGFVGLLTDDQ